MEYKTKGVCSMAIQYDIDDEQKVHNVKFIDEFQNRHRRRIRSELRQFSSL